MDVPMERYKKTAIKKSKPILQLDDNLNIINKWDSITKACNEFNISTCNIISVCKHKKRHAKGYVWCYENDYENFKEMWNNPLCRKRTDTKKGRIELGIE